MPRYPEYQIHSLDTHGYGRIIQTIDGKFYDGWGNTVTFTLFGKEVSINVEGYETDTTDGGSVNNTNSSNSQVDLFTDLQNQINDLKNQLNTQNTQLSGASYVLPGTIVMWGGSVNGIPTGWCLCDGRVLYDESSKLRNQLIEQGNPFGSYVSSSVTSPKIPDLRERFVVGAGGNNSEVGTPEYVVGSKGGVINNTLTLKNIPEHEHQFSLTGATTFTTKKVDTPTFGGGTNVVDYVSVGSGSWTTTSFNQGENGGIWTAGPNPKKDGPGFTWKNINNLNATYPNEPTPIENRPPYFALCYIIKL